MSYHQRTSAMRLKILESMLVVSSRLAVMREVRGST
jgi:hypothetical protein